jgi:hypothetical protein
VNVCHLRNHSDGSACLTGTEKRHLCGQSSNTYPIYQLRCNGFETMQESTLFCNLLQFSETAGDICPRAMRANLQTPPIGWTVCARNWTPPFISRFKLKTAPQRPHVRLIPLRAVTVVCQQQPNQCPRNRGWCGSILESQSLR